MKTKKSCHEEKGISPITHIYRTHFGYEPQHVALPKTFRHRFTFIGIAVGTVIADRPPHRSVRAELPHTAPTLDEDERTSRRDKGERFSGWEAIVGSALRI